jgi:hypothetical protein
MCSSYDVNFSQKVNDLLRHKQMKQKITIINTSNSTGLIGNRLPLKFFEANRIKVTQKFLCSLLINFFAMILSSITSLFIILLQQIARKKPPCPESASELYRLSDHHLSVKLVPTFANRGCHIVSVTDPYGRNLSFLNWGRYFSYRSNLNFLDWGLYFFFQYTTEAVYFLLHNIYKLSSYLT